jgi:hypothetical protein
MSQYRDQVLGRMGLQGGPGGPGTEQFQSDPWKQIYETAGMQYPSQYPSQQEMRRQVGPPPSYLPPSEYAPKLGELADEAVPTPSLEDIAVQTPFMGGPEPVAPRENPVAALYAKMYGATDQYTGLPMDVVMGLREPGQSIESSGGVDLRKLVDKTLNNMNFG